MSIVRDLAVSPSARLRSALAALGMLAGLAGGASAQTPDDLGVPPEMLNTWRQQAGDRITFCVDPGSDTAAFDRDVALALADTLLLQPEFKPLPSGFPIDAQFFWDELLLTLTNECQVAMGMALVSGGYPDWLTATRAYAGLPSVLAVTQPEWRGLLDIPRDRTLGTQITSLSENRLIAYIRQLPEDQRWRRLPYADSELLLRRVQDGSLAAGLIWLPTLRRLTDGDPAAAGFRVLPTAPVEVPPVELGAVLLNRDVFLRTVLDGAIGALLEDGTIARLLEESGIAG